MKLLGLTGGIGMGKSASETLLRQRGVPVIDTDLIARQLVEPGAPALAEIKKIFSPAVVGPDGKLLRRELASRVFGDPAARQRLEAILHPRIREIWKSQVALWRSENQPLAVVVIPLLFETDAQSEFDATLCIACSLSTQRQRLLARGWSLAQINQRLQAQWPIEKKIAQSDYVVWNEAGLGILAAQLDRITGKDAVPCVPN
jgi:dephospho-CoA kinase